MRTSFIISLSLVLVAGAAASRAGPERPNVVVILADDLGYATLGCYGNTKVRTPNLDRLAAEGIRFTAAYAPNSLCTPTRYALLTGEYAWRGPTGPNVVANVGLVIEPDRFTLPRLFQQSGYATAGFGKWNLGLGPGGSKARTDFTRPLAPGPRALGFDYFFGIPVMPIFPPHVYFENEQLWNADPADPLIEAARGGGGKLPVFKGALAAHFQPERVTTELTERLCAFIEQNREKPFFIYYPMTSPHDPFTPDPRFRRDGPWGLYGAYIEEMDWSVGAIMETLEKSGVARDTLIIVTSDNGGISAQGRHLKPLGINPNGSLRGAKGDVYEGGIRVPFVLRWPGVAPAGAVSNQPLQLNDCLATFAALLGRPLGAGVGADSFDLLPAIRGKTGLFPDRALIFQGRGGHFGVRQGDWKYVEVPGAAAAGKGAGPARPAPPIVELYHLADDPGERNDLRTQRPEIEQRLNRLRADAGNQNGTRAGRASSPPKPASVAPPARGQTGAGQFILINLSAADGEPVLERIAREFKAAPGSPVRVGVSRIFSYFGRGRERLESNLRQFLELGVKHDLPVLVSLEGEYWWEERPDLWNWWRPDRPGYDPANRENVEWTSWDPADALKIAWLNWGRQLRVLPPPNFMSPRYRAACHEEMRKLVPMVIGWWRGLPPEKRDLFVGLKVGWESSIGVNKFHYPGGNARLDRPAAEDPRTGITATEIPARGVAQLGYAALKTSGLRTSGSITEEDLVEIVRRHVTDLSAVAARLGVPRDRLFTHIGGWKDGERLYDAAVNEFSSPGWSFYRHARDPAADTGVQRALARSDAPHWAAVEWLHQGPPTPEAWRTSLERTLAQPGCRFLCIFNWKNIATRPAALEAIRAVVANGKGSNVPATVRPIP